MAETQRKYKQYNKIQTYPDFVDYVLRRLGAPVIDINVTEEQLLDRISDAITTYVEYDLESVMNCWWLHRVTQEDVDNGYFTIPPDVLDVMEVLQPSAKNSIYMSDSDEINSTAFSYSIMENPEFQWWNSFWYYGNMFSNCGSMLYYELSMEYLNMMNDIFTAKVEFQYRRREHKLRLYGYKFKKDSVIALYGTKILDAENDECIFQSEWVQAYATACVGVQFGVNLSKFGNVPSAGGLTIDGNAILERYMNMKKELEEEHKLAYREPPMPFIA